MKNFLKALEEANNNNGPWYATTALIVFAVCTAAAIILCIGAWLYWVITFFVNGPWFVGFCLLLAPSWVAALTLSYTYPQWKKE